MRSKISLIASAFSLYLPIQQLILPLLLVLLLPFSMQAQLPKLITLETFSNYYDLIEDPYEGRPGTHTLTTWPTEFTNFQSSGSIFLNLNDGTSIDLFSSNAGLFVDYYNASGSPLAVLANPLQGFMNLLLNPSIFSDGKRGNRWGARRMERNVDLTSESPMGEYFDIYFSNKAKENRNQ